MIRLDNIVKIYNPKKQNEFEALHGVSAAIEDGELVADEIYKNFGRTVTFIRGEGLVSGTKKDVLYSVVTRAEIFEFRKMINSLDVNAFTTVTDVSEIIGNHMKSKSKSKVIAEKNRL